MSYKIRHFISYVLLIAVFSLVPTAINAQDRAIHLTLQFARGTSHATLNKRIVRGTSHVYHLRARKGQYMAVILNTGDNTSFSIYSARAGQVDGADGVQEWDGNLPESGEYIIEIGTDRTANYELTVSIE